MVKSIKQFDVWVVEFDPAIGSEIKKSRPAGCSGIKQYNQ